MPLISLSHFILFSKYKISLQLHSNFNMKKYKKKNKLFILHFNTKMMLQQFHSYAILNVIVCLIFQISIRWNFIVTDFLFLLFTYFLFHFNISIPQVWLNNRFHLDHIQYNNDLFPM